MSYTRILFATDLTERSLKVGQRAKALREQYNATLSLVHSIEHSPLAYGGEFSSPVDLNLQQTIESNAQHALAKQGERLDVGPDHQHLLTGRVKNEVLQLAERLNIDLILVGTHSHHGLEALLGSRANAILHGAQCDVLAVHSQ